MSGNCYDSFGKARKKRVCGVFCLYCETSNTFSLVLVSQNRRVLFFPSTQTRMKCQTVQRSRSSYSKVPENYSYRRFVLVYEYEQIVLSIIFPVSKVHSVLPKQCQYFRIYEAKRRGGLLMSTLHLQARSRPSEIT